MGAGVIPLAVKDGEVCFLFQKAFSGRKRGCLIDFGGGSGFDEAYRTTAAREFVEETETMYFADDLSTACRSKTQVLQQLQLVEDLFERTLSVHPEWWCRRDTRDPKKPKDWRTYFIEFPFRDISLLNHEWETDFTGRFKKRRELHWIAASQLLDIYADSPDQLWKRVRQLVDAEALIQDIQRSLLKT